MSDTWEDEDFTVSFFNAGYESAADNAELERARIISLLRQLSSALKQESEMFFLKEKNNLALKASYQALGIEQGIRLINANITKSAKAGESR